MSTKYWTGASSGAFNTAGNWSDSAAPVNGDVLYFTNNAVSVTSGLTTGLTGLTIYIDKSYTGQIGTSSSPLSFGGTAYIGRKTGLGSPTGSTLINLDTLATSSTINVLDSASSSASTYLPPILVKGSALTLNVTGGKVGVAMNVGETATLTLNVSKGAGDLAPDVSLGSGCTLTAINAGTGTVTSYADNTCTAATISGDAAYYVYGTGAHTTLTVGSGSTCTYSGTGTVSTLNLSGTFDRSRDPRALTITTSNLRRGATLNLDNGKASSTTRTNKNFTDCGQQHVTISTPIGEVF